MAVTEGKDLAVDFFTEPGYLPLLDIAAFRCLVVAKSNHEVPGEAGGIWANEAYETAIAGFARSGGALVVLHSGLAFDRTDGPWFETVRGTFLFHPPGHPRFQVRTRGVAHAAVEGFTGMEIEDEMYFVRVDSARTERLLESASRDYGSSFAAWAHDAGRGRVFCLTPGHQPDVLASAAPRVNATATRRTKAALLPTILLLTFITAPFRECRHDFPLKTLPLDSPFSRLISQESHKTYYILVVDFRLRTGLCLFGNASETAFRTFPRKRFRGSVSYRKLPPGARA